MSCEKVDLKEFFFGEGSREERRRVQSHVDGCPGCREELSRLQLTHAALGALRDEEMPRRIAFVSDKVFEPRWYQRLWNSGPQLGFVAASMLAGAILVHGFMARPAGSPAPATAMSASASQVDPVMIQREVDKRVAEVVNTAVLKAVADSEARQEKKTVALLNAADRNYKLERESIVQAFSGRLEFMQKAMSRDYAMNAGLRGGE